MTENSKNTFLNLACAKIRKNRQLVPTDFNISTRVEHVDGVPFMNLWFRTGGCSYDRRGACTFCNYGISSPVSAEDVVSYVKKGLSTLDINENTILLMTPSGSMFDDIEVPDNAFKEILTLVRNTKCRAFLCETRVEYITEEKIKFYASILNNKVASLEIGLESSNPWVLKYCVNKNLSLDDYRRAMQLIQKYKLESSTTIMHGGAFLSPSEAVKDTVNTVRWALEQGVERACVFPAHVKKWTLLEWLWKRDLYSPPSLWSLIEVLENLGPDFSPRVYIAWHKVFENQESDGKRLNPLDDLGFVHAATTCEKCRAKVIELLDLYRDYHSFATIEKLSQIKCECKDLWRASLNQPDNLSLQDRIIAQYTIIGNELLGHDWWVRNGNKVIDEVRSYSNESTRRL
jgi:radical SAM enzyme (TIGR01210 family)